MSDAIRTEARKRASKNVCARVGRVVPSAPERRCPRLGVGTHTGSKRRVRDNAPYLGRRTAEVGQGRRRASSSPTAERRKAEGGRLGRLESRPSVGT